MAAARTEEDVAARGERDAVDLLVLLPGERTVRHRASASCPMMDLLVQIASQHNLRPSAHALEALAASADPAAPGPHALLRYQPNTPVGQLDTQVIRLTERKGSMSGAAGAAGAATATAAAAARAKGDASRKMGYSESFSNRVQNFNKMASVSAVQICNDPDGFNKLSQDTRRIKSRSNFITSTLPPQVSLEGGGGGGALASTFASTFRLQIHLPGEQLHVIRAAPDCLLRDILDIVQDERGLRLERYAVFKTHEPDLILNLNSTLKDYGITELTLKLLPEFDIKRSVNPKKVKKENSSHFRSAFKSFFHQLKPSSRSNSVNELSLAMETSRPKSEPPRINTETSARLAVQPKVPPRKRGQAPPPPAQPPPGPREHSRSHTASESSCESSAGGSAPATLPRRCRLAPESASSVDLAAEPPLPPLRRGVSDMAVNKQRFARRKRAAPKPPVPIGGSELVEDGLEDQVQQKMAPSSNLIASSHDAAETEYTAAEVPNHTLVPSDIIQGSVRLGEEQASPIPAVQPPERYEKEEVTVLTRVVNESVQQIQKVNDYHMVDEDKFKVEILAHNDMHSTGKEVWSTQNGIINEIPSALNVEESGYEIDKILPNFDDNSIEYHNSRKDNVTGDNKLHDIRVRKQSLNNENIFNDTDKIYEDKGFTINNDIHKTHEDMKVENSNIHSAPHSNQNDMVHLYENKIKSIHNEDQAINSAVPTDNEDISLVTEDQYVHRDVRPVGALASNLSAASQPARSLQVDNPVALDHPDFNVSPTIPKSVESASCHSLSVTPLVSKANDNHSRSTKVSTQPDSSSSITSSKPTAEELLKQIEKIKNKKLKRSQSNTIETRKPAVFKFASSNDHIDIADHSSYLATNRPCSVPGKISKMEKFSPPPCEISNDKQPNDKQRRGSTNGTVEPANAELQSERVAEEQSARPRGLTKFMLTSWAEEKNGPVVKRIADYGSKNSSTQASGERALAAALAATLPRPFSRTHSETAATVAKPPTAPPASTLPTIVNVVEKVDPTRTNDENATVRTSAYARLNLFNLSPSILPDSRSGYNGETDGDSNAPTKRSWELVKDATKQLEDSKVNGERALETANNGNGLIANGGAKEPARLTYKYPKPLQFKLGTWTDKSSTLKIEPERTLGRKDDPPLVTELDEGSTTVLKMLASCREKHVKVEDIAHHTTSQCGVQHID